MRRTLTMSPIADIDCPRMSKPTPRLPTDAGAKAAARSRPLIRNQLQAADTRALDHNRSDRACPKSDFRRSARIAHRTWKSAPLTNVGAECSGAGEPKLNSQCLQEYSMTYFKESARASVL